MKLDNLHVPKHQIYCDLDGVLANFRKKCIETIGMDPDEIEKDRALKDRFWTLIRARGTSGLTVWEDLEFMPGAEELWGFITPHKPIILTASGGFKNAAEEKRAWVAKMLGDVETIVVTHSKDKSNYANEQAILIDDLKKSIIPWTAKGGIGILHTSADQTIEQLKNFIL